MQPYQYQFATAGNNFPYHNQVFGHGQPTFGFPAPASTLLDTIGEGDIATVIFPDGSTRYFFVPVRNPSQIQPFNPNTPAYSHPYWLTNSGVWFVRSISNAVPITVFNRFLQEINAQSHGGPPNCFCSHENGGAYQLKFHHDAGTSTSDLYYFCPGFRPYIEAQPSHGVPQLSPFAGQQPPFANLSPFAVKPPLQFAVQQQPSIAIQSQPSFAVQPPPSFAVQPQKPVTKVSSNVGTYTTRDCSSKVVQVNLPPKENKTAIENMSTSNSKTTMPKTDSKSSLKCTRQTCEHMLAINGVIDAASKVKKKTNCICAKLRTCDKSCITYNTKATSCIECNAKNKQTSMEHINERSQTPPNPEIWTVRDLFAPSSIHIDDDVSNQSSVNSSRTMTINIKKTNYPKRNNVIVEPEVWPLIRSGTKMTKKHNNTSVSQDESEVTTDREQPGSSVVWGAVKSLMSMETGSSISLCESDSYYSKCEC